MSSSAAVPHVSPDLWAQIAFTSTSLQPKTTSNPSLQNVLFRRLRQIPQAGPASHSSGSQRRGDDGGAAEAWSGSARSRSKGSRELPRRERTAGGCIRWRPPAKRPSGMLRKDGGSCPPPRCRLPAACSLLPRSRSRAAADPMRPVAALMLAVLAQSGTTTASDGKQVTVRRQAASAAPLERACALRTDANATPVFALVVGWEAP